jgi:hypothetical protein
MALYPLAIEQSWMALLYLSTTKYPISIYHRHGIRIPHFRCRGPTPSTNPNPISLPCSAAGYTCRTPASVSTTASSPSLSASCEHHSASNGIPSSFFHSSLFHRGTRSAIARRRRRSFVKEPHLADSLLRSLIRRHLYSSRVPLQHDVQRLVITE